MVKGRWWRWLSVPFTAGFIGIGQYRLQRAGYLTFGSRWRILHTLLAPLWMLIRPFTGPMELHYLADIGPGMRVLHPSLGVVVSGRSVVGRGAIFTGGNCVGGRPGTAFGEILIGDDVTLGANAVVLGPVTIGQRVHVAAGAVVVHDVADDTNVAGVPARPIGNAEQH